MATGDSFLRIKLNGLQEGMANLINNILSSNDDSKDNEHSRQKKQRLESLELLRRTKLSE